MKIMNTTYSIISQLLNDYELGSAIDEVLKRVDEIENVYHEIDKRIRLRLEDYHNKPDCCKLRSITDFIVENRYYYKEGLDKKELNLLWIENKPYDDKNLKKDIDNIQKHFPSYKMWLKHEHFDNFIEELKKDELEVNLLNSETLKSSLKVDDIDIIILDLFLDEKQGARFQGEQILKYLKEKHIGIPVIILSISEDFEEVARLYSLGADFFVNKKYALQLPLYIHRIFDKYGHVLLWLNEKENKWQYRKNLLSNLRYWMFHKDFLWYGDKCYHMIDHGFNHIYDNWINTNKLLQIIKINIKQEFDWKDSDIYSFCMAMWLHDIGHKGNERYGEAYQIRDTHGIISGEFILQRPELFNIIEEDKSLGRCDTYYKNYTYPLGNQNLSVVQLIRERRNQENLSNAEKIALLSIFHKSNAPLTVEDGLKMQAKNIFIPSEYFENCDLQKGQLITLQDVLEKRCMNYKDRFLIMMSLFRFIDGIDLHKTRVGDESEKELKLKVINQDKEYYLRKLEETANSLIEKVAKENPSFAMQIYNDLYMNIKNKIEKQEYKLDSRYKRFMEERLGRLENYWMILNYAAFISVQDGHFDLHNCVDDINLINNNGKIKLTYHLNKGITWLSNKTIREMRVEKMTILDKLFGKIDSLRLVKLPYPLDELQEGSKELNKYLSLDKGLTLSLIIPKSDDDDDILKKLDIKTVEKDEKQIIIKRIFGLRNGKMVYLDESI